MAGRLPGVACGLAVATIAASWSVITRLEVTHSLDAWDIAALRFGVAGVLLAPVAVRRGFARERLGWLGLATIVVGAGVPYVLLAAGGLRFAPAYEQSALNPGTTPLFAVLIAAAVLGERLSAARCLGLVMILAGVIGTVGWHEAGWSPSRVYGEMMFLGAGCLWACFTVAMRWARLDPLHAVALVSVGSLLLFAPVYVLLHGGRLLHVPFGDLAVQAMFQGVVVTIVLLLLYGRTVTILGVSRGAAFLALVPAFSALLAIPLLGEWPNAVGWAAIGCISVGVCLTSSGPPAKANRQCCRYAHTDNRNSIIKVATPMMPTRVNKASDRPRR